MKHKFPNLLKPLGTIIQQNYWPFYPSELIYFALFTMRHPVLTHISPFFQRQWNHNPNFDIPTLLRRFHVSIGFICFLHLFSNFHRKLYLFIQDYGDPVQLYSFCHTTSLLLKWGYQFQKQGSTARVVESFEKRTFSDIGRIPESKMILLFYCDFKDIPWTTQSKILC